jgi:hypothetical protein
VTINVDPVQAGGYTAIQDRQGITALLAKTSRVGVHPGIMLSDGFDLAVFPQSPTPDMSIFVAAGSVVIADAGGGSYVLTNSAAKTVTIAASDPTNPRLDLIIARVYDNEVGDAVSTTNLTLPGTAGTAPVQTKTGDIEVVQGTPAGTPGEPSLPNSRCVVLRRVRVRAGTASILGSDLENATAQIGFTSAQGGIIPVRNQTERDALTKFNGLYAARQDTGMLERTDGSTWGVTADPGEFTPWTAYTPVWSGEGGGSSSLGSGGTIGGRYKKVGNHCWGNMSILIGTGATGPSGVWDFTLPVTPALLLGSGVDVPIGSAVYYGGTMVIGIVMARQTQVGKFVVLFHGQTAPAQSGNPAGWGAGTRMSVDFDYETT